MLTRVEGERLASAIHALRADWPLDSLLKFISDRRHRPLLELTLELAWVAQLPETKTPGRIDEDGPWKHHVREAQPFNATDHLPTRAHDDCRECGLPAVHPSHFDDSETGCNYLSPSKWAEQHDIDHHAKAAEIRKAMR